MDPQREIRFREVTACLERQAAAWERLLLDLEDRIGDGDRQIILNLIRHARDNKLKLELIISSSD